MEKWGDDPSQGLYYSVLGLCPLDLLCEEQIQKFIERYIYCERFKCEPFKGDYDDQPAIWVDFCGIMSNEIMKCQDEQQRKKK